MAKKVKKLRLDFRESKKGPEKLFLLKTKIYKLSLNLV